MVATWGKGFKWLIATLAEILKSENEGQRKLDIEQLQSTEHFFLNFCLFSLFAKPPEHICIGGLDMAHGLYNFCDNCTTPLSCTQRQKSRNVFNK